MHPFKFLRISHSIAMFYLLRNQGLIFPGKRGGAAKSSELGLVICWIFSLLNKKTNLEYFAGVYL